MQKVERGGIVPHEVIINGTTLGVFDHYQVTDESDDNLTSSINADLEAAHSTERIGPPGNSNDPARYRAVRAVAYSRYVDEEGRPYWAVVASI